MIVRIVLILFMSMSFAIPVLHAQKYPQNPKLCCKFADPQVEIITEVVATGLEFPWALAFLPNGDLLVTEKVGRLRIVREGKILSPISGVLKVAVVGQGGLLDVVLDPKFEKNNTIYMTFSQYDEADTRKMGTAIARASLTQSNKDIYALSDTRIIFSDSKKSFGGRHFGSRIAFGKDGTLFATLGDRGKPMRAQDPLDYAGSVIRINRDGSVPKDNPFVNSEAVQGLPEIFSIGHRNAQGAVIHPITGILWTLAHGPKGGDELNVIKGRRNYGWPIISYGIHYSGEHIGIGEAAPGYEQPIYYWNPSIAPSGIVFYNPKKPAIPQWNGSLLLGALKEKMLVRLVLEGNIVIREEHYLKNMFGRIRDVRVGPHGAVWLLIDSKDGRIIKVRSKS